MDETAQGMVQAFEVVNDAFAALEESANMPFIVDATTPANLTLSILQLLRYYVFHVTGMTANATLVVPAQVDTITPVATNRVIVVYNDSLFNLTIQTGTPGPGTTVVVPAGGVRLVLIEGINVTLLLEGRNVSGVPSIVSAYALAHPAAGVILLRYSYTDPLVYPANFAGSYGSVGVSATLATLETGSIVFSAIADVGDSVTIYDGQKTTVFTFAASGNGATGAAVNVATGATATDSATNLRAAINANTNINVTAGGATTTVSVTNDVPFHGAITKVDADTDYVVTDFTGLSVFEMDLLKNGVSMGKAAVGASDVIWFKTTSNLAQTIAAGDVLEVSSGTDATVAEIGFTLKGNRS